MTDDYPGGWFGASWGGPVCDEARHRPTPVGEPCMYCVALIADGDQGMSIPGFTTLTPDHRPVAHLGHIHIDCFLREIGAPS